MQLIDSHAHLQWPRFDADLDAVIDRAQAAGVVAIVTLATDITSSRRVIELAETYAMVYAAVGIHPTDTASATERDMQEIRELAAHEKVVAIGETGMDFYWDTASPATQETYFRAQLELAAELDYPVVIHNREAGEAIWRIVSSLPDLRMKGVFHCFGEDGDYARAVLARGFHISFTGNITYRKSALSDVARTVPLERLLLETDSPFLTPVPHRGQRNEPANVLLVAKKHAEDRNMSVDEISRVTTENARKLFRLPHA